MLMFIVAPSAAWHGTRIILRQVSPESTGIFDFLMELYASCSGNWNIIVEEGGITAEECDALLEYAATFLSNVGNYYVSWSPPKSTAAAHICNIGLRRSEVRPTS